MVDPSDRSTDPKQDAWEYRVDRFRALESILEGVSVPLFQENSGITPCGRYAWRRDDEGFIWATPL